MVPIMREQIKQLMSQGVAGWCDVDKGNVLYDLVQEYKPSIVVEIGTFGGRSIGAFALALKSLGKGIVFGIDPWESAPCMEGVNEEANDTYWSNMDWDKIVREYFDFLRRNDLLKYHAHLRKKDVDCLDYFPDGSIDILHIDSNHSAELACQTVDLWLPKLKPKGILVMDDINWDGVKVALKKIEESGTVLLNSYDVSASCFGVYQKG